MDRGRLLVGTDQAVTAAVARVVARATASGRTRHSSILECDDELGWLRPAREVAGGLGEDFASCAEMDIDAQPATSTGNAARNQLWTAPHHEW